MMLTESCKLRGLHHRWVEAKTESGSCLLHTKRRTAGSRTGASDMNVTLITCWTKKWWQFWWEGLNTENSISSTHLYMRVGLSPTLYLWETLASWQPLLPLSALRFDDTSCSIVWMTTHILVFPELLWSAENLNTHLRYICCVAQGFCSSVPPLFFNFLFQKSAANKSCVYRRWREAHGAVAFHGLGESQALSAAVQASWG